MKQVLTDWKFLYADCPEAFYRGYNDSEFIDVTVPHDWSVMYPFSKKNSSGTGYLNGGVGWYRVNYTLPESEKGKKVFVVFDGVYKNAQVWCNSYYLGKRPFGYASFCYDITEQSYFGDETNVLSVRVEHNDIADSRWFTGSGIYRKVFVYTVSKTYIENDGIDFVTLEASAEKANVRITNSFVNEQTKDVRVEIESTLNDGESSKTVFSVKDTLLANSKKDIIIEGAVESPKLWSDCSPSLYTLTTNVKVYDGNTLLSEDSYEKRVGIRTVQFDANKGFFLNGVNKKLYGVCMHHDAGCLGAAVTKEVWFRRLVKLKEMGCNAIRTSHNPHMPELYDLCDSMGFLVIDEIFDEWEGPKNKWSTGHNVYPPKHQGYFMDYPEWHERDVIDFIKRDRLHPSVILWSLGNEIDYPNDPYCHPLFMTMTGNNDHNKPAAERMYDKNKPNADRLKFLAENLATIAKRVDPNRGTTIAAAFPELSAQIGFIEPFDVVGYNYKEHLYDESHKKFPEKPFLGSENSHSFDAWKAVRDCEYISGQFLWTGIDFLGEAHGWPIRGSGAGLLDTAGFEKPGYYRRKSFWSEEPTVKIASARAEGEGEWKHMTRSWNYVDGEQVEVRCYTNCKSAEIYVNGKSFGIKEMNSDVDCLSWFVPYEKGDVKVRAIPESGEEIIDCLISTGTASQIVASEWKACCCYEKFSGEKSVVRAINQIEIELRDGDGNFVTDSYNIINYSVCENGEIVGIENGDLSDLTEYSANYRRVYNGRAIVFIRKKDENKDCTLYVTGENLLGTKVVF